MQSVHSQEIRGSQSSETVAVEPPEETSPRSSQQKSPSMPSIFGYRPPSLNKQTASNQSCGRRSPPARQNAARGRGAPLRRGTGSFGARR